jgi:hypothetical protein
MSNDDIPLFDIETPPVKSPKRRPPASDKARYTKYVVKKPVRCDACMAYLAEMEGHAPVARQARVKRTLAGDVWLLCPAHAQQYRKRDGME